MEDKDLLLFVCPRGCHFLIFLHEYFQTFLAKGKGHSWPFGPLGLKLVKVMCFPTEPKLYKLTRRRRPSVRITQGWLLKELPGAQFLVAHQITWANVRARIDQWSTRHTCGASVEGPLRLQDSPVSRLGGWILPRWHALQPSSWIPWASHLNQFLWKQKMTQNKGWGLAIVSFAKSEWIPGWLWSSQVCKYFSKWTLSWVHFSL